MFKGIFKKADLILLAALVAVGLCASLAVASSRPAGGTVVIKAGGKTAGTYALGEDRKVLVQADGTVQEDVTDISGRADYNIILIKDGKASVTAADCRNQICVEHKPISEGGESIICLPHRIVVEIHSEKGDRDYDTIAR